MFAIFKKVNVIWSIRLECFEFHLFPENFMNNWIEFLNLNEVQAVVCHEFHCIPNLVKLYSQIHWSPYLV